jgi:hypothetical protein
VGNCRGFSPSSVVNNVVLPSKTGTGRFDVLISQSNTNLCNEEIVMDQPVAKPMESRAEKKRNTDWSIGVSAESITAWLTMICQLLEGK